MPNLYRPWSILKVLRSFAVVLITGSTVFSAAILPTDIAQARAGGGRSSSGRRASTPSYRQPSFSQPTAPRAEPSRPSNAYTPPVAATPPPPPRGGFLRSAAGGLAGGFLGSMLFNSLGRSSPGGYGGGGYGGGGYGGGGGGGGGFGLLELLLFAGVAYFGYRWWRNRQNDSNAAMASDNIVNFRMPQEVAAPALVNASSAVTAITAEEASDLFFRIQGAWTRRDLSSVQDILGSEMAADLNKDLQDLKARQCINRLENISIRHVDVGEAWSEAGFDQVGVRFTANLLDYTSKAATPIR